MTCEQCNEWLGDAVDGTLDADRQAQIDAHCRGCMACRELLADLKEIRAAAATLDRLTPSPDVWRAIAAKVERPNVVAQQAGRGLAAARCRGGARDHAGSGRVDGDRHVLAWPHRQCGVRPRA